MIFLTKRTTLPTSLLAIGIVASSAVAPASESAKAVSDRQLAPWVEQRIQQWQVTSADRRFDEIGWAKNLCEAERLAKKHRRPIFLFTHDGRIALGRC